MRIISYVQYRRIISRGSESYYSYIHDFSEKRPLLDSVPIVHNFLNAFSTNLPSIPPLHDIMFIIDLKLGIQLISIVPYHMAPVEIKELNS